MNTNTPKQFEEGEVQHNLFLSEHWGQLYDFNVEYNNNSLIESVQDKADGLYITGVFMQADKINLNGRMYPKHVLKKAVDKYIEEQVLTNQALGELNHPSRSNVDPEKAAIRITELWWDGSNVMGKAKVIEGDHGAGDKTAALIRSGWIPGVSSRGLGSVKMIDGINEVTDFRLTVGVDVVWGPSAPEAYVRAVNESDNTTKIISESHAIDFKSISTNITEKDIVNITKSLQDFL